MRAISLKTKKLILFGVTLVALVVGLFWWWLKPKEQAAPVDQPLAEQTIPKTLEWHYEPNETCDLTLSRGLIADGGDFLFMPQSLPQGLSGDLVESQSCSKPWNQSRTAISNSEELRDFCAPVYSNPRLWVLDGAAHLILSLGSEIEVLQSTSDGPTRTALSQLGLVRNKGRRELISSLAVLPNFPLAFGLTTGGRVFNLDGRSMHDKKSVVGSQFWDLPKNKFYGIDLLRDGNRAVLLLQDENLRISAHEFSGKEGSDPYLQKSWVFLKSEIGTGSLVPQIDKSQHTERFSLLQQNDGLLSLITLSNEGLAAARLKIKSSEEGPLRDLLCRRAMASGLGESVYLLCEAPNDWIGTGAGWNLYRVNLPKEKTSEILAERLGPLPISSGYFHATSRMDTKFVEPTQLNSLEPFGALAVSMSGTGAFLFVNPQRLAEERASAFVPWVLYHTRIEQPDLRGYSPNGVTALSKDEVFITAGPYAHRLKCE